MADKNNEDREFDHVRSITMIRHGRTSFNAVGRIQGQTDIPLDDVGQWQAHQSAKTLTDLFVRGRQETRKQLVVSSDLERTMQTAHAFADPLELQVHADERFRERNFGEWEGMTIAELQEQCPEDLQSWLGLTGGELKHGAEEKIKVGQRGVEGINDWASTAGSDTDLFVFSHGACINETMQVLLGLDRIDPQFGSVISMRNAHWARFIPLDRANHSIKWRLVDYNHGPAMADTYQWEHPNL